MENSDRKLVIVVRPGARTRTIMGWLRQLLPAAVLLVAPPKVPAVEMVDVITLDADELISGGPLALADALASARRLAGCR
jgi:hypothetical protein